VQLDSMEASQIRWRTAGFDGGQPDSMVVQLSPSLSLPLFISLTLPWWPPSLPSSRLTAGSPTMLGSQIRQLVVPPCSFGVVGPRALGWGGREPAPPPPGWSSWLLDECCVRVDRGSSSTPRSSQVRMGLDVGSVTP
jgi:hypothetical protein